MGDVTMTNISIPAMTLEQSGGVTLEYTLFGTLAKLSTGRLQTTSVIEQQTAQLPSVTINSE